MKTLKEVAAERTRPDTVFVMKKRGKYVGMSGGELVMVSKQEQAMVLFEENHVKTLLDNLCCDTRNAKVIGKSVSIVSVYLNR
jgi:hypothetical protein